MPDPVGDGAAVGAERIGVFGGTFDPIHIGHLVAAAWTRDALALDRVLLVVANEPWQKSPTRRISAAEDRYAVVAAALDKVDGLEASRIEIDRGGPSYSVETVTDLQERFRLAALFLIVGADVASQLGTWHRVDDLARAVTLVVVDRGGVAPPPALDTWQVEHVKIPSLEISSSDVRARLGDGQPVDFLVPDAAIRCIFERGLYSGTR